MKKKILSILLTITLLASFVPYSLAATSIPTSVKAPGSLVASASKDFPYSTDIYFSVDSGFLNFIDTDLTNHDELGINSLSHTAQIDWKLNNGAWHYTSDWDTLSVETEYNSGIYADTGYLTNENTQSKTIFDLRSSPGESSPILTALGSAVIKGADADGYDNRLDLVNNTFYFRVRFIASYYVNDSETMKFITSPWSEVLTYGKGGATLVKPTTLQKTTISNPIVGTNDDGSPKITFTALTPKQVQDANNYILAQNEGSVEAEFQININNTGWSKAEAGVWWLAGETRSVNVPTTYDDGKAVEIDKAFIQIRMRYLYAGGNTVGALTSEWSNTISVNTPGWSNASDWATTYLSLAEAEGLIPEMLKGADMTKPITREEFCELAVLLYEKVTGTTASPIAVNPFSDTQNPQILKSFALKIAAGTSATTFSPKTLINREQCAVMLFKAIKAIAPNADYSIAGIKEFPDHKYISSWAVDATKYMFKLGIIKGDTAGNFMPKATTTVQTAAGYGMATREAAIIMAVKSYEAIK